MDAKEQKRKRDRERYAKMSNEKKQEKLRRLREAYQRKKKIKSQHNSTKMANKGVPTSERKPIFYITKMPGFMPVNMYI
jgi:uncharacterized protein (DUF1015 family)